MSYKKVEKVTAYAEMIGTCIEGWASGEVGWLSVQSFAEQCGLPLTHNLRRRLENFAELGILIREARHDGRGRWRLFYVPTQAYRNTVRQNIPF